MASVVRQPFAPLDDSRLQTLTSLKNRQNGVGAAAPSSKRKAADVLDLDDAENINPVFSKRSKTTKQPLLLPHITPRRTPLQPRSQLSKSSPILHKSSPLAAPPAGRSPTKRSSALAPNTHQRRHTATSGYTRVDPPRFGLGPSSSTSIAAAAPFSLDAALKATAPSYTAPAKRTVKFEPLPDASAKAAWFFDIHEDSPEQEMTNLLQHSTCVLAISPDHEATSAVDDKENVAPAGDVSQVSSSRRTVENDAMVVDSGKAAVAAASAAAAAAAAAAARVALREMDAAEFYAEGCDASSVVIVDGDEVGSAAEQKPTAEEDQELEPLADDTPSVDELMSSKTPAAAAAAAAADTVVAAPKSSDKPQQQEGEEAFEVWESGSAKGDDEK